MNATRRFNVRAGKAALVAFAAAALASTSAPAQQDAQPSGKPLTSEELFELHAGRSMSGCYLDRDDDIAWRERFAEDGRLYDLEKGGEEVGSWWVDKGGVVCFLYTDRVPGPHCFTARRRGRYLEYHSTLHGGLVTTTGCGDDPIA